MQIAIVDDSGRDAEHLEKYLHRFSEEADQAVQIRHYPNAEQFLSGYRFGCDLVIMDIDMPGRNGIEAARVLRRTDPDVVLMFVTNMPQYALAGYEVEAVDYVLKPVAYQDFALKLRKALRYIRRNRDEKIALQTTEGVVRLSVKEITYVESMLHYLTYHTEVRDYRVRQTMEEAERNLRPFLFARCSKSFLVNLRYVRAIEKDDVVVNTVRLKMSRGKRKEFVDSFAQFLGGVGD